jgi:hypothetical protein
MGRLNPRVRAAAALLLCVFCACAAVSCSRRPGPTDTKYSFETVIRCGKDSGWKRFARKGWAEPEQSFTWTIAPTAKLKLSLPPVKGPVGLRMRLMGNLDPPFLPVQLVEVFANDEQVAVWLVDAAEDFFAVVPPRLLRPDGKLHIDLKIPRAQRLPNSPPDETRRFGVACYEFEVLKAGSIPQTPAHRAAAAGR